MRYMIPTLAGMTLAAALDLFALPALDPVGSLTADSAREDIRHLGRLLERVHPDPYAGFGGRVEYQRALQELLDGVPEGRIRVTDLRRRIAGFLADMGDGHTVIARVSPAAAEIPNHYLPVRFAASADGLFISDVTPTWEELMGARVESVAGRVVDDLAREARVVFPAENLSAGRRRLARSLGSNRSARELLPELGDSLRMEFTPVDRGERIELSLPYTLTRDERRTGPWHAGSVFQVAPEAGPFRRQLLAEGRVGYLRIGTMWSREAFENMRAAGRTDLGDWLASTYDRHLARPAPEDPSDAIAGFPSLIEEVDALLKEIAKHDARRLIVDLRGNGGGFSVIGEPLL